jgi:hypothetical protein
MRQEELCCAPTVIADLTDTAAAEKKESVRQATGMMETAR